MMPNPSTESKWIPENRIDKIESTGNNGASKSVTSTNIRESRMSFEKFDQLREVTGL
jgi:hypothetical protein